MRAWLPSIWVPLALALVLSCWPRSALAQAELALQVSAREISVGDRLDVQLDAMSDDGDAPSNPELVVPNSFTVQGPSIGTRQQVSITGFRMVRQSGISASWQLTPTRPGVYSIGPASVQAGGQLRQAQAVQIRVLPEGQRPQRQQQRRGRRGPGFNPFDPFGNDDSFDDLFDRLRGGGSSSFDRLPPAPEELVPPQQLDDVAFVDARLDVRRAVVGQQVTLSIYAHGSQGLFQEAAGAREPSHPDFLAQRLVEDGSHQPVYQYVREGQRWIAVKVREIALFPLRAGRLSIGPLEFGFLGRRYGGRGAEGLRRQTPALVVDVSEPPALGRPAGYAGDVGNFELTATVEPRHIPAGGSIAVTARVQGTGRLPGALKLPEQSGVEWLEPTLRDDVAMTGTTLGGSRTFNYVVRLTRAGVVDLGKLSLPLFNPNTGRYRIVLAPLGQVT
ncbi:MAG TPA: BatD family protein, partial [Polyangiaceae bacterium]|nr:BatD family protein [Polyangiaceae bacterium]